MKTRTKILYISLWITGLIAGVVILVMPTLIKADIITTDFTSWQHQGIYLSDRYELDSITLFRDDRIIRINDCTIEEHLSDECITTGNSVGYNFDAIRDSQLLSFVSKNTAPTPLQTIQSNPVAFSGAILMLLCSLLTLINIDKVRWYPQLLLTFLLFGLIFTFDIVRLPITLITYPNIFWIYLALFLLIETSVRAVLLNLILVYPQQRFNKKRTRQAILVATVALPPSILTGLFFSAADLITGIFLINQWLSYYSYLIFLVILLTIFYHLRHIQNPMVNLRVRWMRIGGIATGLLVIILGIFLLTSIDNIQEIPEQLLNNRAETIYQPYTLFLLVIMAPVVYAIPLGELYPRKIDNIENRFLFYLVLGATIFVIYFLGALFIFRFNFDAFFHNPYVYLGFALTMIMMLVLAFLRAPINRLINRWFYRDRMRYQTLLPGFILELSSNLNYTELIQLLLKKLPEKFQIKSAMLMLRQPGGENYGMISIESKDSPEQFSRNHPLVQHFHTTRKPILRYLDQKLLHPGIIALMEKMDLEAAIPLIHLGSLVGIYFLRSKVNDNPYTISELNVLTELDQWAGTAVYNTWVVSEKEDYSRTLELEMEQQSRELNRVVDETRKFQRSNLERSQQRETILGQVHQDLREPLNDITALTTLLAQDEETINNPHLLMLSSKTELLAQRLDIFLDYSAIQNEKFQPRPTECNLSETFRTILNNLSREVPDISEAVSFHIDANTPMLVILDVLRLQQILTHLIQVTLDRYPSQAFVITCSIESVEIGNRDAPRRLSFVCKSHPGAILLHKINVDADQPLLKMELAQQLLRQLNGELLRSPMMDDQAFPFHFLLHVIIPENSFPAYLSIDLPFLKDKRLVIYERNSHALKQMTLHAKSWGMNVTAISEAKELSDFARDNDKPDLIIINGSSTEEEIAPLDGTIRTIIYQTNEEEGEGEKGLDASTMYNLITRAILFTITAEQYPQLPRNLNLSPDSITNGKLVTIVGESDNLDNLAIYLSRFNLETELFQGPIEDLPQYLRDHETDILILELVSKELEELELITKIREIKETQPFIITTSANPIRFPALDMLQAGADKYLLKPYNLEEMLTMIAEWLNGNVSISD